MIFMQNIIHSCLLSAWHKAGTSLSVSRAANKIDKNISSHGPYILMDLHSKESYDSKYLTCKNITW